MFAMEGRNQAWEVKHAVGIWRGCMEEITFEMVPKGWTEFSQAGTRGIGRKH